MDYEYARRRYKWSKRFNWVTVGVCGAVAAAALYWGILRYQDWVWLSETFGDTGSSTRWTPDIIGGYFMTATFALVVGALGVVTVVLGLMFVRKALDEDKVENIKRWSMIAGVTGVLPGAVFGGLLQLFIWRAHASEGFTMFGILGKAPEPAPVAVPTYNPAAAKAEEESRRKSEYDMLFSGGGPTSAPAPAYDYAPSPDYTQAATTGGAVDYGYAPAAAAAVAAPPQADVGTQYQAQPSGAPICTCGRPMEWVPEYNRYYCYTDDKYEGES